MSAVIDRGATALLLLLVHLIVLIRAVDLRDTEVKLLEPDSNGTLEIFESEIDVFSISPVSLKSLTLFRVNLNWDNKNPLQLGSLEEISLFRCELNPNSLTFNASVVLSLKIFETKFLNGTLYDLLRSASGLKLLNSSWISDAGMIWDVSKPPVHLQRLEKLQISECIFNPNSITFSDSLTSLTLSRVRYTNGTMADIFKSATNLLFLDVQSMGQVDISKLLLAPSQTFNKLYSLTLKYNWYTNVLYDILNIAPRLQIIDFQITGQLDLSKLYKKQSNGNQFLHYLKHFNIRDTSLVHGTLYDVLKNANQLETLYIEDLGDLDISNWYFNKSDNSSPQFFALPDHSKKFGESLTIDGIGEVDLRGLNNWRAELFGKLKHLRIVNVTLTGTTLYDILNASYKIEHLEFGQTSEVDVPKILKLQIWERLHTLWIGNTNFVNGNLYDLLKTTINLHTLTIENMGTVDISKVLVDKFLSLKLIRVTLTRSRPSDVRRFQNLQTFIVDQGDAEDSRTLLYNFEQLFPNIVEINTGSQLIVHPKALLSMMNSSAMSLTFSFDFDPPVKTYEFGKAMKKLIAAGYIHGEYTNSLNVIVPEDIFWQRVHLLTLKRVEMSHHATSEWYVYGYFTIYGRYSGITDDIKPLETQAVIYLYFIFLLVFIGIGTTGNILSGIALFKTKIKNSAGVILFALTFFDTAVILTYLASAYFNGELFYREFISTGSKSTEYTVDEHQWLNEQHPTLTFFIYPLNKTVYTASVYTTLLISLERFIAVCWPLKAKYLLRRRNSISAIVVISVFSILLNTPRWIESYEWNTYPEDSPYWNDYYKPTLMRMENYRTIYHGWVCVTFMYILPFILVAFFNVNISRHTKLSNQLRRTFQSGTHVDVEQTQDCTVLSSLTKMLLCVVAVFVVCNSMHIAIVFYFLASYDQIQLSTTEAVSCIPIVINCSVNFLIYVILGKTMRAQFLILLPESVRHFCLTCCRRDMTRNS